MLKSLIVACSENGVIGNAGKLPWYLPADLKHFKALTHGKAVIMGRLTLLSIGKVLPGRLNIILSRNRAYKVPRAHVVNSLPAAFSYAAQMGMAEACVIGGSKVYEAALPYIDKVYLTKVQVELEGDAFFSFRPDKGWKEVAYKAYAADKRHRYAYAFFTYVREK